MSLSSRILVFAFRRSANRFEKATLDPERAQRDKLLGMVERNRDTEYGRKYGFASIRSIEDWRRQVPVITYEDIKEDMNRVVEGAKNVFTAEDPVMFAQTSGTTGDPKYVPVTPTCQGREHKDVMRTWMSHAQRAHPDIFAARLVSLVSPAKEGTTPCGLPFGSTSGHIYQNMPAIARRTYSIPYPVFEIADYESKYYAIMRTSLEHDVRFVCTANPSSILKMCEKADEHGEDIIKDVRDGTLSDRFPIESEIRGALEKAYRPNPQAASALEVARARRRGRLLPGDYWPRVSLIGCWKGGTVGHYLDKFPGWFDPDGSRAVPVRDWGYLSSEARGSIPLSDEGSRGVLTIATNYFEFVAVDDLEANPKDPSAWTWRGVPELQEGGEYYIFVTTTGGLYRYDINDVIKVDGMYNRTPQIVFLRKGRGMTNLTGEKVSVNQVISAFQTAARETGALPAHFKAEADADRGRYLLRAEFANRPTAEQQKDFLLAVDRALMETNIEYKAKRSSQRLEAPVLHVMRDGWYERNRRAHASEGKRVFQAKTEVLSMKKMDSEILRPEVENIVEME